MYIYIYIYIYYNNINKLNKLNSKIPPSARVPGGGARRPARLRLRRGPGPAPDEPRNMI